MGFIIIMVSLIVILTIHINGSDKEPKLLPHECRPSEIFIPENGCVPDSSTAVKIAESIWFSAYGNSIYERKPFKAELIDDTLWIVAGSMPRNMLGGVPYIEILKKDGRVLGIGHGK